jgi:predicted cation transporter
MLETVANWFVVVACFWILYWKYQMWLLTRAYGVFVIMLGFVSLTIIRVGVAVGVPIIAEHSRSISALTVLMFSIGIPWLVLVMRRAYDTNGHTQDIIDSAAVLAKAAAAAQVAREHAIEAADAAEAARLYAKQAQKNADEATATSRMATKRAGATQQASRDADAQVGEEKK